MKPSVETKKLIKKEDKMIGTCPQCKTQYDYGTTKVCPQCYGYTRTYPYIKGSYVELKVKEEK